MVATVHAEQKGVKNDYFLIIFSNSEIKKESVQIYSIDTIKKAVGKQTNSPSHVPLKLPCSLGLNCVRISEQGRIFEMFCCSWSPFPSCSGPCKKEH